MTGHQDHTNDPTTDLSLDLTQDDSRRGSRRRRGLVIAAVALLAAAAGFGGSLVAAGGSDSTAQADPTHTTASVPGAVTTADNPAVQPEAEPQGGGAPAPQPEAQPESQPEPEPEPPAAPGVLKVSKTNIVLPDGVYEGSFTVSNDGGSPFDWSWSPGGFGISASPNAGTLQPGEHVEVTFTINPFAIPEGDFAYAASISSDVGSKGVTITGYRKAIVVNPDVPLPDIGLKS